MVDTLRGRVEGVREVKMEVKKFFKDFFSFKCLEERERCSLEAPFFVPHTTQLMPLATVNFQFLFYNSTTYSPREHF